MPCGSGLAFGEKGNSYPTTTSAFVVQRNLMKPPTLEIEIVPDTPGRRLWGPFCAYELTKPNHCLDDWNHFLHQLDFLDPP